MQIGLQFNPFHGDNATRVSNNTVPASMELQGGGRRRSFRGMKLRKRNPRLTGFMGFIGFVRSGILRSEIRPAKPAGTLRNRFLRAHGGLPSPFVAGLAAQGRPEGLAAVLPCKTRLLPRNGRQLAARPAYACRPEALPGDCFLPTS